VAGDTTAPRHYRPIAKEINKLAQRDYGQRVAIINVESEKQNFSNLPSAAIGGRLQG
jgi:hypothetical protein